jgi:exodeoxyribonuclease V alpha subunit
MQLRNDYERDVFNGDLGTVLDVGGRVTVVGFEGRAIEYTSDELSQLALAYASTVHKVQGSEFSAICVVCYGGHHVMLSRALIYTALTRAKRVAVFVGDPRAFQRAWQNAKVSDARSRLAQRLGRGALASEAG